MKIIRIFFAFLAIIIFQLQLPGQDFRFLQDPSGLTEIREGNGIENPVTIKVIYDNFLKIGGLKSDWGYSIIIEGLEKEILFDTGTKPDIFESNFKGMRIDAGKVDLLVISHEHYDHTEGIPEFVKMKKHIPIVIPYSFSDSFKMKMVNLGLEPVLDPG